MEDIKNKIAATSSEASSSLRQFIFGDAHSHHFEELALERAPKEVACAFAASFLVSPMVSIIDKCIVKDISSSEKFMSAMKTATKEMIAQPKAFFTGLSFRLTVVVYFGTYAVANLSEMFLDMKKIEAYEERKGYKVGASAVANIGLLAWRDSVFAREFGGGKPKPGTPLRTIGLFAMRDGSTMYATFYAAPKASEFLVAEYGLEKYSTEFAMALAIPVATQIVTAPLHIHAMDFYNNPGVSTAGRFNAIRQEFSTVAFARGFRILPAFGIGSFSNNRFREYFIRHDYDPEPNPNRLARRVTKALGMDGELPSVVQKRMTT